MPLDSLLHEFVSGAKNAMKIGRSEAGLQKVERKRGSSSRRVKSERLQQWRERKCKWLRGLLCIVV